MSHDLLRETEGNTIATANKLATAVCLAVVHIRSDLCQLGNVSACAAEIVHAGHLGSVCPVHRKWRPTVRDSRGSDKLGSRKPSPRALGSNEDTGAVTPHGQQLTRRQERMQ